MPKQTHFTFTSLIKNGKNLFPLIGFLLVMAGIFGVIFGQKPLSQVQDPRSDASTTTDNETAPPLSPVYLNHTNIAQILKVNTEELIKFKIDTKQPSIQVIQTVFYILNPNMNAPKVSVNAGSGYEAKNIEVERVSGGYLVQVVAVPNNVDWLIPPQDTSFLHISVTASKPGLVAFTFDSEYSIVYTEFFSFGLTTANHSYPVVGGTPSPSPSPSPTITPSPSPTPAVLSCNQSCSSNAQCAVGNRCFDTGSGKFCRLATNPTSTSCQNQQTGLNRQCNQYCADSSECAAGFSCWFNRCRNPKNIESTSCAQPTATQQQAMAESCRTTCSSNADCAVNLRCYNSECRLAANVSSLTCSAATEKKVSTANPTKGAIIDEKVAEETTTTAKPRIPVTPIPTATPTVYRTPEPEVVAEKTLGQSIAALFAKKNMSLGTILIATGVGVLLLSLILFTFGRKTRQ